MPAYRIGNKNVLFIHVPKTGGTSIEAFLEAHAQPALHNNGRKLLKAYGSTTLEPALAMQHFHADLLESMFPAGFFDYAFMVVRHPLQRLISEYGHSRNLRRVDSRLPFNIWAELALTTARLAPGVSNNHFRPQAEFRCFGAEVFKFEDGIGSIVDALASRLGLPELSGAPHEKRSSMKSPGVSARVCNRVAAAYDADFRTFGYEPLGVPSPVRPIAPPMSDPLAGRY
jgi:hypothetical protein